jgi:hypothetical protein
VSGNRAPEVADADDCGCHRHSFPTPFTEQRR